MPTTMVDKIWEAHEVRDDLIYVDLHLVHEVTSPQAFESLRLTGRRVRRPDLTLATMDHNVATGDDRRPVPLQSRLIGVLAKQTHLVVGHAPTYGFSAPTSHIAKNCDPPP